MLKRYLGYLPVLLALAFVCLAAPGTITISHAADENKDKAAAKKNFQEMKRDLKKAGEKIEKAISEGASTVAQKVKKAFSPKEK